MTQDRTLFNQRVTVVRLVLDKTSGWLEQYWKKHGWMDNVFRYFKAVFRAHEVKKQSE